MICGFCQRAADENNADLHNRCRGGTHCDCQHMERTVINNGSETQSKDQRNEGSITSP